MNEKNKLYIVLIFFSLVLSLSIVVAHQLYFVNDVKKLAFEHAEMKFKEREGVFKKFLENTKNNLIAIRKSYLFDEYLETSDAKVLEEMLLLSARSEPYISKIRYIDENGFEKIKVDREHPKKEPIIFKTNQLQDKSHRYYFIDSKSKELEKVWFSAIDLNKENGKVQTPYRPVIRAVLPIKYHEKFKGILIISYDMNEFLQSFVYNGLYNMILYNDKGEIIYHQDSSKCWSNSLGGTCRISNIFPDISEEELKNDFFKSESLVKKRLDVPIYDGINVTLELKQDYIEAKNYAEINHYTSMAFIVFVFSLILTFFVVKLFSKQLLNIDKLESLNKDLERLALRNKIVLKASEIGVWEWDYETNSLKWDDQMYDIYGLTKTDDSPYSMWRDALDKDCVLEVEKILNDAVKNNSEFDTFFWITTSSGDRRYVRALGVNEFDERGKAVRMVGVNQNITKEKEREMIVQQQAKMASMGEMIGNIAHQWRQPLNALSASIISLNLRYDMGNLDDEFVERFYQESNSLIQKMSSTIDDFGNFFSPDKEKELFLVEDSVKNVFNIVKASLENNFIELIQKHTIKAEVYGYKNEFEQVLVNLINNSKDALITSQNTDKKIEILTYEDDKNIYIEVIDNGGGMSDDVVSKVFEPYFTTKFKSNGTGIGMYMSKNIIEKNMDGKIMIENYKDGAKVTISLKSYKKES